MPLRVALVDVPGKEQVKVIYIGGEVTQANLDEFKQSCSPMFQTPGVKTFIIHMRDLEHVDSKMIGFLSGVYSDLREEGKLLFLAESNPHVFDVLQLVGLTKLIPYHQSLRSLLDSPEIDI